MKRAYLAAVIALVGCDKGKKEPAPAPAPTPTPAAPADAKPLVPSAAGGAVSNAIKEAKEIACRLPARDVQGSQGTSWYMRCPACDDLDGAIWGTDLYTDDSAICLAAIHAGAVSAKGGVMLVTWAPGQLAYVGSARNGINTKDYGKWGRSFFAQSVDADGKPTSPPIQPPPQGTIRLGCAHPGATWNDASPVRVQCPPGCTTGQSLWGTDVYTADSSVCLAAVHAGVIKADAGGEFTLTPGGPVDKLVGSERNGIASKDYGSYETTFTLAK